MMRLRLLTCRACLRLILAATTVVTLFLVSTLTAQAAALKVGGTGAALGSMRLLATAFSERHPDVPVEVVTGLGSSGGIRAVLAGAIDISVAARPLRDKEQSAGAVAHEYARTPFVFATHAANLVTNVSLDQVAAIYAGRMVVWPDGTPIRLVLRPRSDSDTALLSSIDALQSAMEKAYHRKGLRIALTDQESADNIEHSPGSFGTSTLALVRAEKRQIQVLALDSVQPSLPNLDTGAYPLSKTFAIVTGATVSPEARRFIDFIWSEDGQKILSEAGQLWIGRARGAS